jgi:hypothetical protein
MIAGSPEVDPQRSTSAGYRTPAALRMPAIETPARNPAPPPAVAPPHPPWTLCEGDREGGRGSQERASPARLAVAAREPAIVPPGPREQEKDAKENRWAVIRQPDETRWSRMPTGSPAASARRLAPGKAAMPRGRKLGTGRRSGSENMPDISASVLEPPAGSVVREAHSAARDSGSALPCRSCRTSSSSEGVANISPGIFRLIVLIADLADRPLPLSRQAPLRLRPIVRLALGGVLLRIFAKSSNSAARYRLPLTSIHNAPTERDPDKVNLALFQARRR